MKKRRLLASALALLLLLCSCSGDATDESSDSGTMGGDMMQYSSSASQEPGGGWADGMYEMPESEMKDETGFEPLNSSGSAEGAIETTLPEKLIYTGNLSIETLEFDAACAAVTERVRQAGGFVESSDQSGRTSYSGEGTPVLVDRYASYMVRIPSDRFETFMATAGEIGNVISTSSNLENISQRFYDTQSRLEAAQVQYDRLLELLGQAESMEDILTIESRLAEVRYEIESMTTTLRGWQSQVDYSTVHIYIEEVTRYTPPEEQGPIERLAAAVVGSAESFAEGTFDLLVGLIYLFPWLVLLGAVLWLVRRRLPSKTLWQGRSKDRGRTEFPSADIVEEPRPFPGDAEE